MSRTLAHAGPLAGLLLAAGPALADPADPAPETDRAHEVEAVVVTATRLPSPAELVPGARVITEADIAEQGAVFAADVLAEVPGISLYRAGPFGGVTSVRIRGAAQDKTLVLIDGVPQNDPSQPAGGFDFAALDLADVARVEILSGPQGSLWGSDAIGGVIAFVTREPDGLRAELEAGAMDTVRAAVSAGRAQQTWALGLSAAAISSGGVSRADARDGNPERDGYDGRTLGLSGRLTLVPGLTLEARARLNRAEAELDGWSAAPPYAFGDTDEVSDTETRTGFVRARLDDLGGFVHALTVAGSDIDREIRGGAYPSRYVGTRRLARWQADGTRLEGRLGLAFGLEHEIAEGDLSTGRRARQRAGSAFAVARWDATDRLTLIGSLRHDAPDRFDGETTARLSAAWDLGGGWRLTGAWGQGFKVPTLSQALCDFCVSAEPFPALRPERAEGADVALGWRAADGRAEVRATAWRLEVEDQIVFDVDPVSFESVYRNLERTRARGLELEARADLPGGFDVTAGWSWTDAEDAVTGQRLLRTPEHAGSVAVGWRRRPARLRVGARHEGGQLDSPGPLSAYTVINAFGSWDLTPTTAVTLRLENLADVRYQQLHGYGEPGRSAFLGLRLRY